MCVCVFTVSRSNSTRESRSFSRSKSATPRRYSTSRSASNSSSGSGGSKGHMGRKVKQSGKRHSDTLRIINLPEKVPDKVIAYELDREFKKNYDVKSVRIHGGQFSRKFALIKFSSPEDAVNAMETRQGRTVAGFRLEMLLWDPVGPPMRKDSYQYRTFAANKGTYHPPYGYWQEGMDPGASRCLFVGNVHKGTHPEEVDDVFRKYGQILSVDIKDNASGSTATYAFVQMFNLNSACYAKKVLNGRFIGRNRCKVAFGKGTICSNVWIDGLDPTLTNLEVKEEFARFGEVIAIAFDRRCGTAIIQFGNRDAATSVFKRMRGKAIGRNKILVDYASQECKDLFYEHLKKVEKERQSLKRSESFEEKPKPTRPVPHPQPRHTSGYRSKYREMDEPDEYNKELQEFNKYQKRVKDYNRKKDRPDEHWQTVDEASSSGEETPEGGKASRRDRGKKKRRSSGKKGHENSITPESGSSSESESSDHGASKKNKRSPSPSSEKKQKYPREKDISDDESPRLIRKNDHSPFLNSVVKRQFSSDEELEDKKYTNNSPRSPPYIDNDSKSEPMEVGGDLSGKKTKISPYLESQGKLFVVIYTVNSA